MVAKIETNSRLGKTLNYNEKKVEKGTAELIHANGYLKDKERLTFYDKQERMDRNNELNPKSERNTMHIKISFHPSEQLSNEKLAAIAEKYMEGIGFKNHPYLVYRHTDTGVPHIHVVATMNDDHGIRVRDFKIGKFKSEPTRKAIEKEFGLVRAEDHSLKEAYQMQPVDAEKITLGERPTKQALQNTLKAVLDDYNVTSIPELNAVLRQYNMTADIGELDSRKRQHGGLTYKVLDDKGNTAAIPIKASDFYFKPTIKNLDKIFQDNKTCRAAIMNDVRARIDYVLHQNPADLKEFVERLKEEKIDAIVWQGKEGKIFGMTYVDH